MNEIARRRDLIDRRALLARMDEAVGDDGYSAAVRAEVLEILKQALADGYGEVARRFEADGRGEAAVRANAYVIDQLVRVIFDFATAHAYPVATRTTGEEISIVAVGGYGRGQLAPCSDVDLLFLLPYKQTPRVEQVVEYMLYLLWDLGLKVGHATRSVDECIRLAKDDVTIRTSLLDARWLWGNQKLFFEFESRFQNELVSGTGPEFVEAKLAERDGRHERMGDSRYVVEPNIKEGKGGLRDLQTLYWIAKYLYQANEVPDLVEAGVFTPQDGERFVSADNFLWTVRCHIHYKTGRAEERLTFDVQSAIAERMGYADTDGVLGVEQFMKAYFLVSKDVGDLTRVLCAVLEDQHKKRRFFKLPGLPRRRPNVEGFGVDGGRLAVTDEDAFRKDPVKLLRLFHEAHMHDLDIHPNTLRLVASQLDLVDDGLRSDPEANRLFLEILCSRKNPEDGLRQLNESGVFGEFVPDFGRVVAQMQYDMYHTYTVDEHTIRAMGILHKIETGDFVEETPNVTAAIKEIQSRRALYVAVFLHDIAKGRGGDHSVLGEEVANELCPRLGMTEEETETVAWLVRQHLLMSHIAFKRDIDDPRTVLDFVDVVQSVERLRLLAVLTVADIKAVGPTTWNNWKSGLLRGLYLRALEVMSGDMMSENRTQRIEAAKNQLREAAADWDQAELEDYISTGYAAYWLAYDCGTHLRHAEIVREAKQRDLTLHIDTRIDDEFDFTEITIYTPDHPGLFNQIAGAMALAGATIMDAKIVTMSDGMVLDSFSIRDAQSGAFTEPAKLQRLYTRIEDGLAGKYNPAEELAKSPESILGRRQQYFNVAPRVLIDNRASSTDSVIEVNGRDRPGFLHDVTAALLKLGLKISSAHILTYGERAVDVFYVKDVFGLKVTHDDKIEEIRERLMEAVGDTKTGERANSGDETVEAAE